MTARDLRCESMYWRRRPARRMGGPTIRQLRINHAKRIFTPCLWAAVIGVYVACFLAADKIGVLK